GASPSGEGERPAVSGTRCRRRCDPGEQAAFPQLSGFWASGLRKGAESGLSGRPPSGRDCAGREDELSDLDAVQGRPLAQVVAGEEEREPVLGGRVAADPPDEHLVSAGGLARGGEVLEPNRRRRGE